MRNQKTPISFFVYMQDECIAVQHLAFVLARRFSQFSIKFSFRKTATLGTTLGLNSWPKKV